MNSADEKTFTEGRIGQPSVTSVKPMPGFATILKIFIVCFFCVMLSLLIVAVTVIEMDTDLCRRMRHIPEVEFFQYEMYDPFKTFVRAKYAALETYF